MRNQPVRFLSYPVASLLFVTLFAGNTETRAATSDIEDQPEIRVAVGPKNPVAGQPVKLLFDKSDFHVPLICQMYFQHSATRVSMAGNVIQVRVAFDDLPEPPYEGLFCPNGVVSLGSFPEGEYQVVLHQNVKGVDQEPREYSFTVTDPHPGDLHHPAYDYSGLYWSSGESGNSLQITQTVEGQLGAVVTTFDEEGRADWFVMGAGNWETPYTWTGPVWRAANGWPFLSPMSPPNPYPAQGTSVGEGRLVFAWWGGIYMGELKHDFCRSLSVAIQIRLADESTVHRSYQCFEF